MRSIETVQKHDLSKSKQNQQKTNNPLKGQNLKARLARLFSLCVICCAAPYFLVTFGVISVSTGAYLGRILEVTLIFGLLMLVSYLAWRHFRSRQTG